MPAVQLAQLGVQVHLLFGQLLATVGQLLELGQQAAVAVQQLPALAQGGLAAPGQQAIELPLLLAFRPLRLEQARLLAT
ncbi:hypothetical protein D3C84_268960 [compost metagenome]